MERETQFIGQSAAFQDAVDGVFTPWNTLMERETRISPLYAHLG